MGSHVASHDDAKSPGSDGASPYQRSFPAAILELVENNSTNNDATLNDLLPEGRNIHQVQCVVQYPDNQRSDDRSCNCPNTTRREGSATDDRGRDGIQFVADAKTRLP
jgi:hypothetical protein